MDDLLAKRFAALAYPKNDADWLEVVRLAQRRRRRRAWPALAAAAAAAIVASGFVAVATPAFGELRATLVRAFGDGEPAPANVQRAFEELDLDAPPALATRVRSLDTRKLVLPSNLELWIAPTDNGGFCWAASDGAGRCDADHTSSVAPVFSITGDLASDGTIKSGPVRLDGSTTAAGAASVEIQFADGDVVIVPVVWVTAPIDAGFFSYRVPQDHWRVATRPILLIVRDAAGEALVRDSSVFTAPSFRAGPSTGLAPCVAAAREEPCLGDLRRGDRGVEGGDK